MLAAPQTPLKGDVLFRSQNRPYYASLDYLRAFAAITVVLYHAWITYQGAINPSWKIEEWPRFWNPVAAFIAEGHTAVGLFMVLSGYVLSIGVIGRDVDYWKFVSNRILRIYPLYVLLLLFAVYLNPKDFGIAAFVQTLLPFANLPGVISASVVTAMFWAVAVEFQFYLIFPFIMKFIRVYGRRYIIWLLMLSLCLRTMAVLDGFDFTRLSYATIFGRIDQFLIGILAASVTVSSQFRKWWTLPLSAVLCFVLIFVLHRLGGYPVQAWWKILWPTVEGAIWALVILASISTPLRMPLLLKKPIASIASMSFSIYLLHSLVLYFAWKYGLYFTPFKSVFLTGVLNGVLLLIPTLALSWLTYITVERPFLSLRGRYI